MRILVSFKPRAMYDNFEGARLRKSIKGALEVSDIPYVNEETDDFDIAHFVSPIDEKVIDSCIKRNIPVVISALYCESDKSASFTKYTSNRKGRKEVLTRQAIRALSKATIITVPSERAKQFLIDSGISKPIEVVYPTINLTRFPQDGAEKEIFYRHYQEEDDHKLVVCLGSYESMDGLTAYVKLAKKYPKILFYYFSQDNKLLKFKIRRAKKKAPSNLKFKQIPQDDIYRSAIINASIFTYFGYSTVGITTVIEAMAARCDVVLRKQPIFEDILHDGVDCHIGEYSETIASVVKDLLDGTIVSTKEKSLEYASTLGLDVFGKRLKDIYSKLLKEKN